MFPTVAEVLELDVLRRGSPQVVAGSGGLQRPVRWVHISELADIAGMLHGGELVLTTGVMLPDDKESLARYIDGLADVGAAGLVVELGRRYADVLPRPLVRAAERRGLPLVALRTEVRFVAVTEAVHAHVVDAQLTELRASEAVHQTFNELSVEGAEPGEVVREVARMAGAPVVLENLSHQVLAFDPAGRDPEALLDGWERRSRGVHPAGRTGHDPRSGWLVTAVGARGRDWGRLVIVGEPAPTPSSGSASGPEPEPEAGPEPAERPHRHSVLLERGAATLALNRLLERDRESLERQTHRTLLSGILTHALTVSDVALRARALGVPLEGRRLVGVMLRLRGGPVSAALEAQARLRDFTETAAQAVRERGLTALTGTLDDGGVGVLVSLGPSDHEHAALEDFAAALTRLTEPAPDGGPAFVMAAGSSVGSLRDARRTLLEAAQVADAAMHGGRGEGGRAQPSEKRVGAGGGRAYYRLPDVRLRGLLHLLRDDARLQTYVERELGPLLAYDAEHGTDLVRILTVYLDAGRNKSAAADAAHLSRPSFYDRLHRVERVLGIDLDQVESCLSLHVALLALDAVRR
ncbi:PucR family transcriptional regulator ligand-binding domain-containing protein [Streptomyces sp. NPDC005722]